MESKNHICNKIMVSSFEDFLKSAIASCILIEKYQGYFVRIIFRAAPAFLSSFNKNESRFLLCLSYNLHNVPELVVTTGFPKDYKFTETKVEVVKQIGNAVPPNFAKAINF